MICKGAYCWNPLRLSLDTASDDVQVFADAENVVPFLDSRMEGSLLPNPQVNQAMANGVGPPLAAVAAGALANGGQLAGAVAVPIGAGGGGGMAMNQPLLLGAHNLGAMTVPPLVQLVQLGGAPGGVRSQQLLFHVVCLVQRSEERLFIPRIELYWQDILETVLPLGGTVT